MNTLKDQDNDKDNITVAGAGATVAVASSQYKLKPLDFSKCENHFIKREYLMTKKNPFKTMSDVDWEEYVKTHEPHFTSEPHYELIPWEKLRCLETDAIEAGWELVLRTTNNTAYCPGHVDQKWCQRTQWIFAYPGLQFIILISYNEDRFSLFKEEQEPALKNYFHLEIISTTRLKTRKIEYDDSDYDCYMDDYSNDDYKHIERKDEETYIEQIKEPKGWIRNGGMTDANGTCNFNYIFVSKNANKYNSWLFSYTSNADSKADANEDAKEDKKDICLLETQFHKSFWKDLIENNKEEIIPGKFAEVQISHWEDTNVLPGAGSTGGFKNVLQWEMSFLFIKKFMKSNIQKWITKVYGFECADNINTQYWENNISWEKAQTPEFKKISTVTEVKHKHCNEWVPLDKYSRDITLFMCHDIRLSANAEILIDQMWEYIKSKN